MNKFGFTISQTRSIDMDDLHSDKINKLLEMVPSYKWCIGCGGCTASCSAGAFTDFNIRRIHNAFLRGQYKGLDEQLQKCMLCGKCLLVCPRGVNTRSLIINMRRILANVPANTFKPKEKEDKQ